MFFTRYAHLFKSILLLLWLSRLPLFIARLIPKAKAEGIKTKYVNLVTASCNAVIVLLFVAMYVCVLCCLVCVCRPRLLVLC